MAEKLIRSAIIGCGGIANGKHMPSVKECGEAEMVAFCDIIRERAEKAAKEFGTPDAKVYTDYKELLKDSSIEAVHVCTPNISHSEITVAALDSGKHVICEKPMAINYEEAKKMIEARDRSGKVLTIGYQNRNVKANRTTKELAEKGELGEIYFAKAHAVRRRAVPTWGVFIEEDQQGGGPLIDIGTHALDLTLWIMDNYEPESVLGQTFHKLNKDTNTGNAWGDWDTEKFTAEDSAFGLIKMKNGATIFLESSWAINERFSREATYTLCGTKAGVDTVGGGLTVNGIVAGKQYEQTVNVESGGVAFYEGAKAPNPSTMEQMLFYGAIKGKCELVVKPEQAIVVTKILDAIYESAKTGKAVYFD